MSTHSHCRTNCGSTDCPAPRAAKGFQTTSASRASPQPAAQPEHCTYKCEAWPECGCGPQPEQPEPGGLTEAQALAIADKYGTRWAAPDEEGISFEKSAFFDFLSEVLATRKRTAEQNARIMEAMRKVAQVYEEDQPNHTCFWAGVRVAEAEFERLLGGEA